MRSTTDHTTIWADLLDADGYETGRQIPVLIMFATVVDGSYGEDADGNRGVLKVTIEILSSEIYPSYQATLTPEEQKKVIREAEVVFDQTELYHL